jgi:O-antigen ligase
MNFSYVKNWFNILYVCFLVFGYPIVITVPLLFGIESTPFSVFFRILYLIISLFIILKNFLFKKRNILNISIFCISVFLILYSLRLVYDIYFKQILFNNDIYFPQIFWFFTVFFPSFSLILTINSIDKNQLIKTLHLFIYFSSFCILILILNIIKGDFSRIFSIRMFEIYNLSPITISFYGSTILILSFYNIYFTINKKYSMFFDYLGIIFGILLLFIGASRGPFITSAVIIIFLIFKKIKISNNKLFLVLKIIFFTILLIIFLNKKLDTDNLLVLDRVLTTINDGSNNQNDERFIMWSSSFDQFLTDPIFGNSYLEKNSKWYPHNIFIEVLLSTGLIGFFLFIIPIAITFIYFIKSKNILNDKYYSHIFLIFIADLFSYTTSGGIFMANDFFLIFIIITSVSKNKFSNISTQINFETKK